MNRWYVRSLIVAAMMLAIAFTAYAAGSSEAEESDEITIAIVPKWEGIPYFTVAEEGAMMAAEELGVTVDYIGPSEPDASQQVDVVNNLILRGVDAIGISVMDANVIESAIAKALEAGMQVFTWDSDAPNSEREVMVQQVAPDELGYTVMDVLAEEMNEEGQFAIITGDLASNQLNEWMGYVEERYEAEYSDTMTLTGIEAPGVTFDKVVDTVTTMMNTRPEISGYVGMHSAAGPGIAAAAEQAGVTSDIKGVAITTPNNMRKYLTEGESAVQHGVLWDVKALGYLSVWVGKQLVEGGSLSAEVPGIQQFEALEEGYPKYMPDQEWVLLGPPLVFDKDNVENYNF